MRSVPRRLPALGPTAKVSAALAVALCLMASPGAPGVEARKIRWVASVYIDAQGKRLRHPEGVACGPDFFVVADTGNSRLLRYGYRNESATAEAEFPLPQSSPILVQVNSKADLYFLDGRQQEIGVVSAAGENLGNLKLRGVPSKKKVVPRSFKIDREDRIYVLDIFSERVLVLDPEGGYLRHLDFPQGYVSFADLAVDALGAILLLDSAEVALYQALPKAEGFSRLGDSLKEFVNHPTSLETDESGTLYLTDQFGSGIALVGRDGAFLGRALGMGWVDSRLFYPSQLCIGPEGNVAIADRSNSRVQLFTLGGK